MREYLITEEGGWLVMSLEGDPLKCLQIAGAVIDKAVRDLLRQGLLYKTAGWMTPTGAVCVLQEQGTRKTRADRRVRIPSHMQLLNSLLHAEIQQNSPDSRPGALPERSPRQSDKDVVGEEREGV